MMKKLPVDFYTREDVVAVARELVGKIIVSRTGGQSTAGRIVETEAYRAFTDRASHAYAGRRTPRNEAMYAPGGTLYVYICYGLHQMVNVVTNRKDVPDAVLIRAIEPIEGLEWMEIRTGKKRDDPTLTRGPGNVGKALGIHKAHSGSSLRGKEIFLAGDGWEMAPGDLGISPRIGVDSAGDDALRPYRFFLKGNLYVSRG